MAYLVFRNATSLIAALNALGAALPLTLGSSVLLYGVVAPTYLGAGVMAGLIGLILVQAFTMGSSRPVYYGARFFEAATLGAMVTKLAQLLAGEGLPNTPEIRLSLLISIVTLSALVVGGLWAFKAQRFVRFIPAPVYVGFVNAVAVAVLLAQMQSLVQQAHDNHWWVMPVGLAGVTLAIALGIRRQRPEWPATGIALLAGLLMAWLADPSASHWPRAMSAGEWALPVQSADASLWIGGFDTWTTVGGWVVVNAIVMGVLVFLNTVATGQSLAQSDGRETPSRRDGWRETLGLLAAGAVGAAPLSGAPTASFAAARCEPIALPQMAWFVGLATVVVASQTLVWLPIAAVTGVMLFDAWNLWNRDSGRRAWALVRGRPLATPVREDLWVIASVMAASLLVNMVAGLMAGLLLGLLLHAHRSTRQPVRTIWSGLQVASNCARTRDELAILHQHGAEIRVFQLDSQQFFASASVLNRIIRDQSQTAHYVVIDWSRVQYVDSSVAQALATLHREMHQRGQLVWQAGTLVHGHEVDTTLRAHLSETLWAADLDRALERAEQLLIQHHSPALSSSFSERSTMGWVERLAAGDRMALEARLESHQFDAGDVIVLEGEASNDLWFLVTGRASVYRKYRQTEEIRLAGISAGTTVGEMGFLDGSLRSATVVAEMPVEAWRLSRGDFDWLSVHHPAVIQQLLTFLTTELAARLRYANQKKLPQ